MKSVLAHTHTPPTPPSGAEMPAGAGRVRLCATLTLADTGEGPAFDVRLARLLKVALRTFGMKCVDLKTQHPEAP